MALLKQNLQNKVISEGVILSEENTELTLEIPSAQLHSIAQMLRDDACFDFSALIDLCGIDYRDFGVSEWVTDKATSTGFDRAVDHSHKIHDTDFHKPRFAVVYHLLSYQHNHRLRCRTFLQGDPPLVDSVTDIWPAANWYEREAFDLFGILFKGHPDLRRILTDYGFIGHPFRKDFPVQGTVEVRYDAAQKRVVYEPVDLQRRVLVPKVIRHDNRYLVTEDKNNG